MRSLIHEFHEVALDVTLQDGELEHHLVGVMEDARHLLGDGRAVGRLAAFRVPPRRPLG